MVGSIGVAPPLNMALYAGDAWIYGGNLDYNRVTSGTTLHFPVYRAGAHLFLGDGHAAQGDGEISGQGLETSLDVDFTVELVKGNAVGQLWSEDAESVMVHGFDNSLDAALQSATSGMARWLKLDQKPERLRGRSGARHLGALRRGRNRQSRARTIVARLPKATLATIIKP
jgi:acetamidase/formamidase